MANDGKILAQDVIEAKKIVSDLDEVGKSLKSLLADMNAVTKQAQEFKTAFRGQGIAQKDIELEAEFAVTQKERVRLEKALATQLERTAQAESKTAKALAKSRFETQKINKENKQAGILTSKYADAYDKLSTRLAIAKRNLKNLTIEQGVNAKATIRQRAEVERLSAKIKIADNTAGDFQRNVGNYPTSLKPAIGAIKGLVGAFGLVEGIRLFTDLIKESTALAREAKGVEFAFNRIGKVGQDAFARVKKETVGLLSNLEIKKSIVEFDQFGLSVDRLDVLMKFLSVTAAETGKNVDQLKSSLIEGISKNSKQRIDNLGISTSELNEELKKTPDFMEAVANIAERRLAKSGDILKENANQQERFNASLENTKLAFGKLLDAEGFSFFGFFADVLDRTEKSLITFKENLNFLKQGIDDFTRPVVKLIKEIPFLNDLFKKSEVFVKAFLEAIKTPNLFLFAKALRVIGAQLSGLGAATSEAKNQIAAFFRSFLAFKDVEFDFFNPAKTAKQITESFVILTRRAVKGGKEVGEAYREAYEKAINQKFDSGETRQGGNDEDDTDEDKITKAREALKKLATEGYGLANEEAKKLTKEAERYTEALADALGVDLDLLEGLNADELNNELKKVVKNFEEVSESGRLTAEQIGDVFGNLFNTFGEYYNIDTQAFTGLFDEKKNTVQDYANVAQEANQFILGNALERYDAEIEKNRERLDAILNDESASDKKKELARKKFDEKEKKIRIRQAKAKQDAVLAGIAIDTAAGIVSAFAQVPKYDYGVSAGVLAALIAGTGIAQAAVVKATGLPKFYKGTMFAPEGWAMTDEKGAEIHTDKSGNIKDLGSSKGARYKYLEKGDRIYTAQKSRQLLENFHTISNREILQGFNQSNTASQYVISNNEIKTKALEDEVRGMRQDLRRLAKLADRPINVNIEQPYNEY